MKKSIEQKVREYMEILGVYVPEENAEESTEDTCIEKVENGNRS